MIPAVKFAEVKRKILEACAASVAEGHPVARGGFLTRGDQPGTWCRCPIACVAAQVDPNLNRSCVIAATIALDLSEDEVWAIIRGVDNRSSRGQDVEWHALGQEIAKEVGLT